MVRLFRLTLFVLMLALALTAGTGHSSIIIYHSQVAFNAAASPSLLEDFESVVPKDVALSSFTSNGVTYASSTNVWVASPGYTNFGAGVGTTTSSILTATGDENFTAVFFSTPYFAVGFDTYLNGLGPATAEFYGTGGLLGSYTYPGNANDKEYLGIVSTEPIVSFHWVSTLGRTLNTGIDNISVSSVPTPEPATMLLVGFGLLGMAAFRRKFKK